MQLFFVKMLNNKLFGLTIETTRFGWDRKEDLIKTRGGTSQLFFSECRKHSEMQGKLSQGYDKGRSQA